ncbi:FAD-dependent oxidoreductase [Arthrobacter sp. zg-Y769]|uniref:FAD-dependent oxidoreductase n=1 Tax=Arthrobacter sp. zg-Y769 TaxID=2894191 RepID=UPI001E408068|nr:FAD-dependent oxidoreductase [Arthrobacter sp. zg-Y769]MCC9205860.1 FAD-dependent oxidoreductase [Arthrobacter sp. zg-Y769]
MTPSTSTPKEFPIWDVDVLVAGSGAGGLSAAVAAAYHGLDVLVAERAPTCGGATARSGGWMWTPGNPLAKAAGVEEPREAFRTYLRHVIDAEHYDAERIEAFLEAVPHMVAFFHEKTALRFVPGTKVNDIYGKFPGAGTGHRSVAPEPFYGTELRPEIRRKLAHQFYMTSFMGMGIMAGEDLSKFLTALRKPSSFHHAARRVLTHLFDLAVYRRNMQMVNGVALTGRLLQSADNLGVRIEVSTSVEELTFDDAGAVVGAWLSTPTGRVRVNARRGVVLATGGYPANIERRRQTFERTPTGREHWTLAPDTCDGAGAALAESVGGWVDTDVTSAAAWCPVSLVNFPGGRTGVFPHIADRAKPGVIGVLRDGKRFVNEANGYWDYVDGMMKAVPEDQPVESWLISGKRALRTYMLGFAKPRPLPVFLYTKALKYLIKADTIEELAAKCGIDPQQLARTVQEFNANAERGVDPGFGRGETPFNRYGGDPDVKPNPTLAPLGKGPYYAVKVLPGSFGTFAGIAVDSKARVLRRDASIIRGLYATGNDQVNIMGGSYPAGGVNLGPAMTFGYVAGRDLAGATAYEDDGTPAPGLNHQGSGR